MSFVDVIVPCYRYGHFLRECVESILAQDISDVRVLIIDDASPDDTAEIGAELAKEDSRVTFSRHSTNKGHIATYNEGIEWVNADYMLLLSADDYLLPGALRRSVKLMDKYPEVGFTFGKAIELADSGALGQEKLVASQSDRQEWRILQGLEFIRLIELSGSINIVPTPTAVVRTEIQKRLGGYRSELPHTGDMEMWLRLAAYSSVGILDAYQAVWRRHGSNMQLAYYKTNNGLPDLQQRKAALDCFYDTCNHALPDIREFHLRLLKPLALEAVRSANRTFNNNEMELSEQFSEFALSVWPEIRGTLPWTFLTIKRLIGVRVSHALVPAVAWIRQAVSNLLFHIR